MLSHWLSLVNVVSSSNYSVLEIRRPFCRILRHKFPSGCSFFSSPVSCIGAPKGSPLSCPRHPEPACRHLPPLLEKGPPSRFGWHCHLHIAAINRPGCCRRSGPRALGCRGEKVCFLRCSTCQAVCIVAPIYLSGTNFAVDASMSAWSDFSFSCHNSVSVEKNNPASSALPIVVAPSHTTPQLSQSQPVTSPVALNESDSSARLHAPPSEHPPQFSPPPSIYTRSSPAPVSDQ